MPVTMIKETVTYTFAELDESAQDRAYEKYAHEWVDYDWWDFSYDYFVEIGKLLGFHIRREDISFSLGYSQSDYCSFTGDYYHTPGGFAKLRKEYGPDIAKELGDVIETLRAVQKPHFWDVNASICHSYYNRNGISVENVETPNFYFYDSLNGVDEEIRDAARWFAQWMYEKLREEYEYLTSREQFAEMCEANDYRFTEEGTLY